MLVSISINKFIEIENITTNQQTIWKAKGNNQNDVKKKQKNQKNLFPFSFISCMRHLNLPWSPKYNSYTVRHQGSITQDTE